MDVFTDYLAAISDACHRKKMQEVLDWVRTAFPSLAPRMGWNQPMFTDHGTFIIGFSVSKQHFAVSPEKKGIMEFSKKIEQAGYSHGTHIFRIRWDDPIHYGLLEEMIRFNRKDKKGCTTFWRT